MNFNKRRTLSAVEKTDLILNQIKNIKLKYNSSDDDVRNTKSFSFIMNNRIESNDIVNYLVNSFNQINSNLKIHFEKNKLSTLEELKQMKDVSSRENSFICRERTKSNELFKYKKFSDEIKKDMLEDNFRRSEERQNLYYDILDFIKEDFNSINEIIKNDIIEESFNYSDNLINFNTDGEKRKISSFIDIDCKKISDELFLDSEQMIFFLDEYIDKLINYIIDDLQNLDLFKQYILKLINYILNNPGENNFNNHINNLIENLFGLVNISNLEIIRGVTNQFSSKFLLNCFKRISHNNINDKFIKEMSCINKLVDDLFNIFNKRLETIKITNISNLFYKKVLTKCEEEINGNYLKFLIKLFVDSILNKTINKNFEDIQRNYIFIDINQNNDNSYTTVNRKESEKFTKYELENNSPYISRKKVIISDEYIKTTSNKKNNRNNNFNMPLKILDSLKNKERHNEINSKLDKNTNKNLNESKKYIKSFSPFKKEKNISNEISPKNNSINKINIFEAKYIIDKKDDNKDNNGDISFEEMPVFYSLKVDHHNDVIKLKNSNIFVKEKYSEALNTSREDKGIGEEPLNYPCVKKYNYKNMRDIIGKSHEVSEEEFEVHNKECKVENDKSCTCGITCIIF